MFTCFAIAVMAVKLHFRDAKAVLEGELFAVDPVTSTVIMACGQDYKIILNNQITKVEGEIAESCAPGVPPSLVRYGSCFVSCA